MGATQEELDGLRKFAECLTDAERERISLEQLLDLYRHSSPEDIAAIREALVDLENGEEGQPLEEFIKEMEAEEAAEEFES